MTRKTTTENGRIYHVLSRSISNYVVFRSKSDYQRMKTALLFFMQRRSMSFSKYMLYKDSNYRMPEGIIKNSQEEGSVDIIAYCIMPTHIHILLSQRSDNGISNYMNRILNSYTKHFNASHRRRGPLWEGRFKKVLLEKEKDILNMTRYIHLNPVLSFMVDKAEKWDYSSYGEYTGKEKGEVFCSLSSLKTNPATYRKFVDNNGCFQKALDTIQPFLLE
ncbi:MAG TPA: transposase [bacterium]|nr:transposase [bacterium]